MWGAGQARAAVVTDLAARWQQGEQREERESVVLWLVDWSDKQIMTTNQSEF